MDSNFRENLRNELDFQEITVKELSAKTNIPIGTLDCYMRIKSAEPSAGNAVKIARALQVSVEYLLTGIDTNNEKKHGHSMEAQEIICWVESLNIEQCKSVLRLIKTFGA